MVARSWAQHTESNAGGQTINNNTDTRVAYTAGSSSAGDKSFLLGRGADHFRTPPGVKVVQFDFDLHWQTASLGYKRVWLRRNRGGVITDFEVDEHQHQNGLQQKRSWVTDPLPTQDGDLWSVYCYHINGGSIVMNPIGLGNHFLRVVDLTGAIDLPDVGT